MSTNGTSNGSQLRPSVVTANFYSSGQYVIKIKSNAEMILAGIKLRYKYTQNTPKSRLYAGLRSLTPEFLKSKIPNFEKCWREGIEFTFAGIRNLPS